MNHRILFVMCFFMPMGLANFVSASDHIATFPEEPIAYEPFEVEFSAINPLSLRPDTIDIDVTDKNIVIDYMLREWDLGPYGEKVPVTVLGFPSGEYSIQVFQRTYDGEVLEQHFLTILIGAPPPTTPAYTFYHPGLHHYFVTASEDEREFVLDNDWHSADRGFSVWPAEGPAPEVAVPVCRFFIEQASSHFYSANTEECDWLETLRGYEYEGIAFQALVPNSGACPSGTEPVWRLYNNGHMDPEREANHRFVASRETYRSMMATGWAGEGVAFCSPPDAGD